MVSQGEIVKVALSIFSLAHPSLTSPRKSAIFPNEEERISPSPHDSTHDCNAAASLQLRKYQEPVQILKLLHHTFAFQYFCSSLVYKGRNLPFIVGQFLRNDVPNMYTATSSCGMQSVYCARLYLYIRKEYMVDHYYEIWC